MRYNEKNSLQVGKRNVIPELLDEDTIVEVSAQIMTNVNGKLQANYDLVVCGNIEVDLLSVMGNFICFGNCKVKNMNVQGSCDIFGNLEVQNGLLSDTLRVHELNVELLEVKGKIICDSLDCQGKIIGHDKVIVSEGIMGNGELKCGIILCGEYAFVENNENVFVANEIEERLVLIPPEEESEEKVVVEDMAWDECGEYLDKLAQKHNRYRMEYDAYLELIHWSEFTKLGSMNQYIELTDLLAQDGEIYRKSDLYKIVKEDLWKKANNYIFDLQLQPITQDDFSKLLYITMKNREAIPTGVYEYIRETIFNRIGLKYSTVEMMLGDQK